jgi:hypothetical protein
MEIQFRPSLSNLPLQMSLFFNAVYSIMFGVIMAVCAVEKVMLWYLHWVHLFTHSNALTVQVSEYEYNLQLQKYALIPIVVFWILVEFIRIYYGMSGNLREKVPDLLTYLLISVFPQLPLVLYLAFFQEISFPIDPIMGVIMLIVLVSVDVLLRKIPSFYEGIDCNDANTDIILLFCY